MDNILIGNNVAPKIKTYLCDFSKKLAQITEKYFYYNNHRCHTTSNDTSLYVNKLFDHITSGMLDSFLDTLAFNCIMNGNSGSWKHSC